MSALELSDASGALIVSRRAHGIDVRPRSPDCAIKQSLHARSFAELVVAARAADCCWKSVRDLLGALSDGALTDRELGELSDAYSHLSIATAAAVLQFYQLNGLVGGQPVR